MTPLEQTVHFPLMGFGHVFMIMERNQCILRPRNLARSCLVKAFEGFQVFAFYVLYLFTRE